MYGAVSLRSRICGVLTNAEFGGGTSAHPAGGLATEHAGSGPAHGVRPGLMFRHPRSLLLTVGLPARYGLVKLTCGTPVLCSRLSVNCGPPWHSMQPPLPWNSFSPASAGGDSVPRSKSVTGGAGLLMMGARPATSRPASASQSGVAVLQSPVTNRF